MARKGPIACKQCGKPFLPHGTQAYCSEGCRKIGVRTLKRETSRRWREEHPESSSAFGQNWYTNHIEEVQALAQKAHEEKIRLKKEKV